MPRALVSSKPLIFPLMTRNENKYGTAYNIRGDGLVLRVVDRTDGERFIEGWDDTERNAYFVIKLTPAEIKELASAFVEMSAKIHA